MEDIDYLTCLRLRSLLVLLAFSFGHFCVCRLVEVVEVDVVEVIQTRLMIDAISRVTPSECGSFNTTPRITPCSRQVKMTSLKSRISDQMAIFKTQVLQKSNFDR